MLHGETRGRWELVTGPAESGKSIYSVFRIAERCGSGFEAFHNGTAGFGRLASPAELIKAVDRIPQCASVLIEHADRASATKRNTSFYDDPLTSQAVSILTKLDCLVLLTAEARQAMDIADVFLDRIDEIVFPRIEFASFNLQAVRVAKENAKLSELPKMYHSAFMAQNVHTHTQETFDTQKVKMASHDDQFLQQGHYTLGLKGTDDRRNDARLQEERCI